MKQFWGVLGVCLSICTHTPLYIPSIVIMLHWEVESSGELHLICGLWILCVVAWKKKTLTQWHIVCLLFSGVHVTHKAIHMPNYLQIKSNVLSLWFLHCYAMTKDVVLHFSASAFWDAFLLVTDVRSGYLIDLLAQTSLAFFLRAFSSTSFCVNAGDCENSTRAAVSKKT